jgi:hypothetical protein
MKHLIKELLREGLEEKQHLEEGYFKSMLIGLLMTAGLSWGQIKPEYKAKIDSIQKITTLTPQQKRAEVMKIVQLNRDEISGKHRADFLKSMAAAGYTDEKEFREYQANLSKQPDAGLDLQDPNFKTKSGCKAAQNCAKQGKKDFKKK